MEDWDSDLAGTVAFDERLAALAGLIGSVDRPGDYCAHGRLLAPMPRLVAADAGALSFPIPPAQLEALIAAAASAPFGRGEETVLDRSVRACLQIASDRIALGGRSWGETLGNILDAAAEGLGCPWDALRAELYKLLIYEPGGFFAPHRDTEKAAGMVATLTISLPVAGTGGELVIRHGRRETVVDMRTDEPSELAWAAFYADCEHETLPVEEGHRVCLVYNLVLEPGGAVPPRAPDHGALIAPVASEIEARCRDPEASGKLVWLLEHDYSEAGFSFATLKNVDAAIARVLAEAAERAGCLLHAAILHVEETASAWYEGWDDEVEDVADGDYEFTETIDAECWLDGWVRADDVSPGYGALPLLPGETMPAGRLDLGRPDRQRLTEATGNEGATVERQYRRAALVLWRAEDSPRVLARGDTGSVAALLAGEWRRATEDGTAGPAVDLALQVAEAWPPPPPLYGRASRDDWLGHSIETLRTLCGIGNREAILRFLENAVLRNYEAGFNGAVTLAAAEIGAVKTGEFLRALVRSRFALDTAGIVDLAERIGARPPAGSAWRDALRKTVSAICAELPSLAKEARGDGSAAHYLMARAREPLAAATLVRLFSLAWRFGLADAADRAAALFIDHPELVPPDRTIPVLLEGLVSEEEVGRGTAFAMLWRCAAECLLSRSATPPRPPKDRALPADRLSCGCECCAELRRFCADPVAGVLRIPVRRELRAHLRREIERASVDISCETERRGSPYTLVCTKTRASHERRLRQYREDIVEMRRLAGTAETAADSAALAWALRAAVGRAG